MSDLKPPLTGYSLWFMPSGFQAPVLQRLIDSIAESFNLRRFDAHATLIGLLERGQDELRKIKTLTAALAEVKKTFDVEIIGIGQRNIHFQSVFLTIVPPREMMTLSAEARRHFHHLSDPPYMPHFSGAYGDLLPEQKQQVVSTIQEQVSFPTTIKINRIALVDCTGYPDEWKILEEFPLGTK